MKQQIRKVKSITITLPLHIAETLHGLIDGCIGTSGDDGFTKQMSVVRKKLEKEFTKHYTNFQ